MNLTAQLKLEPTAEQAFALSRTLVASNAACDYISGVAWDSKTFRQFDLHRLCYREGAGTLRSFRASGCALHLEGGGRLQAGPKGEAHVSADGFGGLRPAHPVL